MPYFADRRGRVHRDVKPRSIIISPTAGAVLIDFGLAWPRPGSGLNHRLAWQDLFCQPGCRHQPHGIGKWKIPRQARGAWTNALWYARTASWIELSQNTRVEILGFRCALSPVP